MAEKRGQYEYRDDGTVGQLTTADTNVKSSEIIQGVDIQSRYQQTIQTHNAVSVPANGSSTATTWIDCDGFDKFGITMLSDGATNTMIEAVWSNDGVSQQGQEVVLGSGGGTRRAGIADVKARYLKLQLDNSDATLAHTMSSWVLLKS